VRSRLLTGRSPAPYTSNNTCSSRCIDNNRWRGRMP
jgi:hypothetical protein